MKILYDCFGMKSESVPIEEFVSSEIKTQREGALEEAASDANAAIEAIARLVNVLAVKGVLTAKEIGQIASGFNYDITFEETSK